MLELTNVINISVSEAPVGLGEYNVNNLALFSVDPFLSNVDNDQYRVYVSPAAVATDFGSDSETYEQAVAIFSQQPNILAGGGNLIIFPLRFDTIQAVAVGSSGSGYVVGDVLTITQMGAVLGRVTVATVYGGVVTGVTILDGGYGYASASNLPTTGGSGSGATITISSVDDETLAEAILRVKDLIFFVGILSTDYGDNSTWAALASSVQAYGDKILFLPSAELIDVIGVFTTIKTAAEYNTRCLYYSTSALEARLFAAAYASRGLSVNYDGSNTAITMNLKQLSTIVPDESITQTIWQNCKTAGVDIYVSYAGVPAVVSNGANKYFDQVINLIWFVSQLKVNGFNALALVTTKVPQTEPGISVLKGAYREACNAALANGYVAPGRWTSSEYFGNQEDFILNIGQRGFYIYSQPVALQSAADRADRKAPLIQIAIKEAGAVQSSNVIVQINP